MIRIEIARPLHLPEKNFSSNIWALNFDESCSKDVVALSRDRRTHCLHVSIGKIIPKDSELDCEELMVSSCKISKVSMLSAVFYVDATCLMLYSRLNFIEWLQICNTCLMLWVFGTLFTAIYVLLCLKVVIL